MGLNVITGATGLLGSYIAESLVAAGERVRAIVRPSSDTSFLRSLGIQLMEGDLNTPSSLPAALDGADVVYHSAARVGEWGPWRSFKESIVDTTANLVAACRQTVPGRLLHVSSISVYGHPRIDPGQNYGEDRPLGQNLWWWDYYPVAKIAAEEIVRAYPGPWTMVRPSWFYGPRDRTSLPRVLKALRAGRVGVLGKGDNLLNIVYAGDVAEGAIRAAQAHHAVGQAYNLSSEGAITQREFIDALTQSLGLPRVRRHFPYGLAFFGGFLAELIGKAIRLRRPPHFTRYAVALIGRPTRYSIALARKELGWEPKVHPIDGLRRTLDWYFGQHPEEAPVARSS